MNVLYPLIETSTQAVRAIAEQAREDCIMLSTTASTVHWGPFALERMKQVLYDSGAGWAYADYREDTGEKVEKRAMILTLAAFYWYVLKLSRRLAHE